MSKAWPLQNGRHQWPGAGRGRGGSYQGPPTVSRLLRCGSAAMSRDNDGKSSVNSASSSQNQTVAPSSYEGRGPRHTVGTNPRPCCCHRTCEEFSAFSRGPWASCPPAAQHGATQRNGGGPRDQQVISSRQGRFSETSLHSLSKSQTSSLLLGLSIPWLGWTALSNPLSPQASRRPMGTSDA